MLNHTARFLCGLLLASCAKHADPYGPNAHAEQKAHDALVARVGRVELHESDLQRAMARDPGASPERFQSPTARRELIDGLVRFELLVQAADRAGLTKDPDAIHALQQIAVTKLVNQTLGAAGSPETITQADVEREYHARQASDFTLPEAAYVRHILVSDSKLAEQLTLRAKALAATDESGFSRLVSEHSLDAATRSNGGDLGFIDKTSRLSPALVEAALSLRSPGDVAGPVHTSAGYEVLRLVSRRAGAVSPLSSVEEQIRQRLYREKRSKALDDFILRLRQETPIEVAASATVATN